MSETNQNAGCQHYSCPDVSCHGDRLGYSEGVKPDGEDWFSDYLDSRDDLEEEGKALDLSVDDAGML